VVGPDVQTQGEKAGDQHRGTRFKLGDRRVGKHTQESWTIRVRNGWCGVKDRESFVGQRGEAWHWTRPNTKAQGSEKVSGKERKGGICCSLTKLRKLPGPGKKAPEGTETERWEAKQKRSGKQKEKKKG